ncbi:1-phosphatidylinositol 4,5-bisphosphate phosphodiesterase eta-2 [Acipenser ruthenus]|uniref:Phosphoinositide phospholipase C n=1 Tax=Acipenser ruthenus TaxID=7906 RepID=A0A444V304_ACIRT|nr:1-phosphatidylinositol 4,5-bisphosphate phosphodiesterase eta-2 [Acipenser ruthenus]
MFFAQTVALNYQSEGRVLQLNRAKFYTNGNCGYVLKPKCMCEGAFNPVLEDPLPGQLKKQLVLRIISGQQLPKPKDSMLGDRGEIIDPFVEVEIIGLPADCCKEQTRVVDDNGFNPMWEETLVFTLHMPEIALIRFLVWDHDPIGRDFIGQRTIAFTSMMSGYRHVYLEGMEEASIFVHIAVNDITGKMANVTREHCIEIVNKFEPCSENQKQGVLGIDGFTNYMRSPAGDIFNPEQYEVNQDMSQPLCNYFISSSHNTYLMGDQLMSQSRVDMYAWVLQAGCRCVEVDCWDGPDGEPIVHHGYTLTSKILFRDVIETINKNAFVKNQYPVILSLENHCSVPQQKKMAQYLVEVMGDKLDLSSVNMEESGRLPSPEELKGKILVKVEISYIQLQLGNPAVAGLRVTRGICKICMTKDLNPFRYTRS